MFSNFSGAPNGISNISTKQRMFVFFTIMQFLPFASNSKRLALNVCDDLSKNHPVKSHLWQFQAFFCWCPYHNNPHVSWSLHHEIANNRGWPVLEFQSRRINKTWKAQFVCCCLWGSTCDMANRQVGSRSYVHRLTWNLLRVKEVWFSLSCSNPWVISYPN